MKMMDSERERLIARKTLQEVTRKLEEALRLSRQLEAQGRLPSGQGRPCGCNHKGVHG